MKEKRNLILGYAVLAIFLVYKYTRAFSEIDTWSSSEHINTMKLMLGTGIVGIIFSLISLVFKNKISSIFARQYKKHSVEYWKLSVTLTGIVCFIIGILQISLYLLKLKG